MAVADPYMLESAIASDEAAGLYLLIAETIPHMVWSARPDGALDFFNRRCTDYTGIRAR